jgi:two-component system NarL family response regulator
MQVRLVIADDHALFRQGLKALLRYESDFEVAAEVSRASDLLPTLAATPCDVLLLDLQMERWLLDDIASLARIAPIVVVTASERTADALAALKLGAAAVVQKRFVFETLIEAIQTVADGLVWMPPAVQAQLTAQWRAAADPRLTAREAEIVRSVALGKTNAEVAEQLSITEGTVKTHLNNVFKKLGVRNRLELALHALKGDRGDETSDS